MGVVVGLNLVTFQGFFDHCKVPFNVLCQQQPKPQWLSNKDTKPMPVKVNPTLTHLDDPLCWGNEIISSEHGMDKYIRS